MLRSAHVRTAAGTTVSRVRWLELAGFGLGTLIAVFGLCHLGCFGTSRTNIVLVVIDTLRADHLPFYGYDRNTAPHLAGLADDAFVFDECLTPVPLTDPAFASLLTGTYPVRHGVRDTGYQLSDDVPSLVEDLQRSGYHTAAFFSREGLASSVGLGRGFDIADDSTLAPHERASRAPWNTREGAERWQRRADEVTDAALAWLDERRRKPFFLLLHYFDPHAYYGPPAEFSGTFAARPTAYDHLFLRSWWGPVSDLGAEIARYDEEILTVDANLERFLDALRGRGLWDDALIVVTADHGESLGEHGAMDHGEWLWREQVRVPLVMRLPSNSGVPPRRIPDLVRLIDVMPTILDLAGVRSEAVEAAPGHSLRPALEGEHVPPAAILLESENCPDTPDDPTYLGFDCAPPGPGGKLRGIRDGRWKLVLAPGRHGVRVQLFDVVSDPGESTDVARDHLETVARLTEEIRRGTAEEVTGPVDEELVENLRALGYAQ